MNKFLRTFLVLVFLVFLVEVRLSVAQGSNGGTPGSADTTEESKKAKSTSKKSTSTSKAAASSQPASSAAASSTPSAKPAAGQRTPPANSNGMVWVNTDSGVYHKPGSNWYGKTKQGKYMTEADAKKAGYRAAEKQ